jgi:hypothetical protein
LVSIQVAAADAGKAAIGGNWLCFWPGIVG